MTLLHSPILQQFAVQVLLHPKMLFYIEEHFVIFFFFPVLLPRFETRAHWRVHDTVNNGSSRPNTFMFAVVEELM